MGLSVNIKHKDKIESLSKKWSIFEKLNNINFTRTADRKWNINGEDAYCIQCMVIGKTGYGKSTTLNVISGKNYFEVSDIKSTTKVAQSTEWHLKESNSFFSLIDLPGIGESLDSDENYLKLYSEMLDKSDCIVYILRADQRDFKIDSDTLAKLNIEKNKLIIGLNYCDKIEPISRVSPFSPSEEQYKNIKSKVRTVSEKFDIDHNQIVPYSATEGWQLDSLIFSIIDTILIKSK